METRWATAVEIREAVVSGAVSAERVVSDALGRLRVVQPVLNAFIDVFEEEAIGRARKIDGLVAGGERGGLGPLAGVPVVVKDNICLAWGRTTCASRVLEDYRSPFTATAARRLIDAGAVIIAKANLDEFAMGSSCEHSVFGPTRNPWDTDRAPGGSSGGSAAAVAAGVAPLALGSDTGGSIRQPASHCGVVGFKPTYGRVSRYGLVAFASSLDQIGPMTRTVEDCALALSVLCGFDPRDSTSAELAEQDFRAELDRPVEKLRLGVPRRARGAGNHPAVTGALEGAVETYRGLGAEVVDIDLPHIDHGIAAYYIIAPAEASSNLARYDGVRYGRRCVLGPGEDLETLYSRSRAEGFGEEVQRRIMLGTHALSSGYYDAYYNTALKVRRLIKGDYDRAFGSGCHAVLMPAAPAPAFRLGEKLDDPLAMYLEDFYTVGVNLSGLPGVSVPAGFAREGGSELPVGVQLIGPALGETRLLRIARAFEKATEHHTRHTRRPAI